MATQFTPVLKLAIPDDNATPWGEAIDANWNIIDAVMAQLQSIPNFQGVWLNSTAYTVGESVVDATNATVWSCNVAHTSPAPPTTFAQDRTTNNTRWTQILGPGFAPANAVNKAGDTMTGTLVMAGGRLSFANRLGATNSDLSKGIDLFGGGYGFCITANRLNYNVSTGASHRFLVGGTDRLTIDATGINVVGNVTALVPTFTRQGAIGQGGWIYNGTGSPVGASHAIGFAWNEAGQLNRLAVYIDGVRVGYVTPGP